VSDPDRLDDEVALMLRPWWRRPPMIAAVIAVIAIATTAIVLAVR
jgi:hypothetical protein